MEIAQQFIPVADTWGMHGDVGWGWMIGMMFVMVLFWGAIIFGAIWLIRAAVGGRPQERKESPLDVLERRFAEGAISVEDYRARREVLGNGTVEPSAPHDKEAMTAPRAGGGSQS
jgi:putative membrane protein